MYPSLWLIRLHATAAKSEGLSGSVALSEVSQLLCARHDTFSSPPTPGLLQSLEDRNYTPSRVSL